LARWTTAADVDDQLRGWLEEAFDEASDRAGD
jgi:hypothetical protein